MGQSSPAGKYCRHVVYCWSSNRVQDILFANNNVTWGKFIHQSYFWYMEKVFMYSYNKLCLEWSELFTCSKKLGESVSPSQGRNLSPLLCSWAGMWSPLGQRSASLLQLGTEFTLCISSSWTPVCNFRTRVSIRTVGDTEGEKRYMFYFWAV